MKFRDTVSSVLCGSKLKDTECGKYICIFRQALALDERRVKFIPEYVEHQSNVKEVWFVGNHSGMYVWHLSSAILILN